MSKNYEKTSTYSGDKALKEFAKAAGYALASFLSFQGTDALLDVENKERKEAISTAVTKAGKRFDTLYPSLLASNKPVNVVEIDKADTDLGTCLLRQNPDRITILKNGSLESNTPVTSVRVNPKNLRTCYTETASAVAEKSVDDTNSGLKMFAVIAGIGMVATAAFAAGNGACSIYSGGQYLYRRRKEKSEELALK